MYVTPPLILCLIPSLFHANPTHHNLGLERKKNRERERKKEIEIGLIDCENAAVVLYRIALFDPPGNVLAPSKPRSTRFFFIKFVV